MPLWQQILMAVFGLLILVMFWPGAKAAMEKSRQVENPDWQGALLPVGIVVLFVFVLIFLARS